jgi:bis(5'-nucleosyl)-tetraphosphatase (symmetrical)
MSLYLIGDLQGCHAPFQRLLDKIAFSPSRDTLYILGDLVNRGPESLKVLRSLSALGDAAQCLLGNHDLHLLAVWQGVRKPGRSDTVQGILEAKDSQALLDWLRHRAMALYRHGWLMVHAGVLPQWTAAQTVALGSEVEQVLRGGHLKDFLQAMYGNTPRPLERQPQGRRPAAGHRERAHAPALLHTRRRDGLQQHRRPRQRARWPSAVV